MFMGLRPPGLIDVVASSPPSKVWGRDRKLFTSQKTMKIQMEVKLKKLKFYLWVQIQASNSDSDIEGEVYLRDEVVSALEEVEEFRKKNRLSNIIISQLESQLLDAEKVKEDLNLQLKRKIQES